MDPIANMLVALKNGGLAKKESVVIPHSKFKLSILNLLKDEGYVKAVNLKEEESKKFIEVALSYENGRPKISGVIKRSLPSKRVYTGVKKIMPFKYGHGMTILSTPKGVLSDRRAREEMVGGEVLFAIW